MTKDPKEPQVSLALTPDGVSMTIQAFLRGDDSDLHQEAIGAWILGVWEKVRVVAEVNSLYGLTRLELPVQEPSPVISLPIQPSQKPDLNELIERNVRNGSLLPTTSSRRLPIDKWRQQALQMLREGDGLPSASLQPIDPTLTRNAIQQRLYDLRGKGLVEFRHTGGAPSNGRWYGLPPEEGVTSQDLITSVLPYTRGKVFLMLGGRPVAHSKEDLEKQLSLTELRWPELEDSDPIEWRTREIRREDVDLVIINRFNKKYSRQFPHLAQEAGKPFLYLTRGYGVRTVAAELKTQVIEKQPVELQIAA